TIVGVNKYQMEDDDSKIDILVIDEAVREHQIARLERARTSRDQGAVANALEKLKRAAQAGHNTMPATIEAVRAYSTLGEICDALRDVYGLYEEPAF
ncbi:MAG: methylmalonyl-CoA mutase family protein, partial [Acidobacteria bacterium]|nr:methylmalonyl-CoA mutase family protein [Acidobacteriota bacterium]